MSASLTGLPSANDHFNLISTDALAHGGKPVLIMSALGVLEGPVDSVPFRLLLRVLVSFFPFNFSLIFIMFEFLAVNESGISASFVTLSVAANFAHIVRVILIFIYNSCPFGHCFSAIAAPGLPESPHVSLMNITSFSSNIIALVEDWTCSNTVSVATLVTLVVDPRRHGHGFASSKTSWAVFERVQTSFKSSVAGIVQATV